jgi:hypothetical protein
MVAYALNEKSKYNAVLHDFNSRSDLILFFNPLNPPSRFSGTKMFDYSQVPEVDNFG